MSGKSSAGRIQGKGKGGSELGESRAQTKTDIARGTANSEAVASTVATCVSAEELRLRPSVKTSGGRERKIFLIKHPGRQTSFVTRVSGHRGNRRRAGTHPT